MMFLWFHSKCKPESKRIHRGKSSRRFSTGIQLAGMENMKPTVRHAASTAASHLGSSIQQTVRFTRPAPVHLSFIGKTVLTVGGAITALMNPSRDDLVAALGETTGRFAIPRMYERMKSNEVGRNLLKDKPSYKYLQEKIPELLALPPNTFGYCYGVFMHSHGFRPDERTPVRFIEDEDLAYVINRYRECHDFWHALFALKPSFFGEVALKWVEAVHFGLPMAAAGAMLGPLRFSPENRIVMIREVVPWATKTGLECSDLLSVEYDHRFEQDVDDLRRELNVKTPKAYLTNPTKYLLQSCRP